ncbi:MAG: hypothetical protein ACR2LL_11790 [Nitrosopumilus sp.]|nr:hypothetical protein [Nitrosopumilus sp.]
MNVKCPNCSHKFPVSEDNMFSGYDIDYNDSEKVCLGESPILRSSWDYLE